MNTRSCSVVVLHFCLHPQTCFQGLTFNMIHLGLKVFRTLVKAGYLHNLVSNVPREVFKNLSKGSTPLPP